MLIRALIMLILLTVHAEIVAALTLQVRAQA
jgi:hypothetical protein